MIAKCFIASESSASFAEMDPLEMMDEVQFEDFSVMEEIELDEDGEEVNRILTENVHPYDNGALIGNGDDDQDDEARLEGIFLSFSVCLV